MENHRGFIKPPLLRGTHVCLIDLFYTDHLEENIAIIIEWLQEIKKNGTFKYLIDMYINLPDFRKSLAIPSEIRVLDKKTQSIPNFLIDWFVENILENYQ